MTTHPMHAGRVHHNLQSAMWWGETTKTPVTLVVQPSRLHEMDGTTISSQPCGGVKPQGLQSALWCSRPGCMGWMEPQSSSHPFGGVKPQGLQSPLWCSRPGCNGTTKAPVSLVVQPSRLHEME